MSIPYDPPRSNFIFNEFDYNTSFSGLTGTTGQQKVFAPFDYESGVKYPYSLGVDVLT